MWTAKTKFLFFCWLSFYTFWIPISVSKLLHFSRIIPNQIIQKINVHWYLHRNCLDIFPRDGQEWINKKRENSEVQFIYKIFICLENIVNKFERLSHTTWWKIKKNQGWMINKYKASNVEAKKFIWILCNIIDLLTVFTFEQKN